MLRSEEFLLLEFPGIGSYHKSPVNRLLFFKLQDFINSADFIQNPFCSLVNQITKGLKIEEHEGKKANNCSGGTKRKLSYAMAMLGDPKIVLLDEPSSGMDPQSKRFVWDTILASFKVTMSHWKEKVSPILSSLLLFREKGVQF